MSRAFTRVHRSALSREALHRVLGTHACGRSTTVASASTAATGRRATTSAIMGSNDPSTTTTTYEDVDVDALTSTASCEGACSRTTPRLTKESIERAMARRPLWTLVDDGAAMRRAFTSKSWATAMEFLNNVSEVAEREGHHPDIAIKNYRDVEVVLSTHAIGGLSRFDFILAAKIDDCDVEYSPKWAREHGLV
jgi:4a-hydroxytetrahydrobiopterin dehydratase